MHKSVSVDVKKKNVDRITDPTVSVSVITH